MAITNRRRVERHRVRVLTAVEPGGMQTVAEDASASGLFLRCSRVHPPGVAVDLLLSLPTGPARSRGLVRWARRVPVRLRTHVRGGMGIQFIKVSKELHEFLSRPER